MQVFFISRDLYHTPEVYIVVAEDEESARALLTKAEKEHGPEDRERDNIERITGATDFTQVDLSVPKVWKLIPPHIYPDGHGG